MKEKSSLDRVLNISKVVEPSNFGGIEFFLDFNVFQLST